MAHHTTTVPADSPLYAQLCESGHATVRRQQRGIRADVAAAVAQFGCPAPAPGGALAVTFDRRALREVLAEAPQLRQYVRQLTACRGVVATDGTTISVMWNRLRRRGTRTGSEAAPRSRRGAMALP